MSLYNYDQQNQAFLSNKIELYPTDEQKEKINKYIIATNYVYDKIIEWMTDLYIKYMNDEIDSKFLSRFDSNKMVINLQKEDKLLQDIPMHIITQAYVRAIYAFKAYLDKRCNFPLKHYPDNITRSFSIDLGNSFYIKNGYITLPGFADKSSKGQRVGKIKCQNIGLDTSKDKIFNGSIYIDNFDKYYFYYTYLIEKQEYIYKKSKAIGIDLGYRLDGSNTIVCSDGTIYKLPDVSHLISRVKYFQSKNDNEKYKIAYRKLYNTLDTFYNQSTIDIIKKNPEAIILEDCFAEELKIRSKNNFIDYGVTSSGKIRQMIIYKANLHKIPVYIANRNFKSSYICSKCYYISRIDLKCRKIFKCEHCGCEIDRDLNAAINLSNIYNFRNSFVNYNHWIKDIIM